jgi:hypothetical protein
MSELETTIDNLRTESDGDLDTFIDSLEELVDAGIDANAIFTILKAPRPQSIGEHS